MIESIKINWKDCFGIKQLEHEFKFASGKPIHLLYAPNGTMKTSFAKTMKFLSGQSKEKPCDKLHQDEESKYDVFGLTYYYLSLAIQKGHLACIPSLCELLMQDGMHNEAFMFTYIGAQKKEIYCMWNLAMYYLCGVIVPKSEDKAVELFESILDIINAKDSDKSAIYYSHYDGINKDEILELKEYTEHNLKIVKSNSDSWKKYFGIEVCRKYQKTLDMLMKEHCLNPSFTGEMYAEKVKEFLNQEL